MRFFVFFCVVAMMAGQEKAIEEAKPIPLSAEEKVAVLQAHRDAESAAKAKLVAEREWRDADEAQRKAQDRLREILAELQKKHACESCSLDLGNLVLGRPVGTAGKD